MSRPEYKVGGEVDSRCGKCKAVRSHIIVAMVDNKPKRVECLACHAVHNYRPPSSIKAPRDVLDKAVKKTKSGKVSAMTLSEDDAVDYTPKGKKYESGMVLRHAKFGLGLITRAEPKKLTVMFNDQTRQLVLLG